MSITFPDNPNRQARVTQLATDAQNYLQDAQNDYLEFTTLLPLVNDAIQAVYKGANLQPPTTTSLKIFQLGDVSLNTDTTVVDVSEILTDVAGFGATVKYLIPGATRALVETGVMSAQTAGRALAEFTIPLIDREVSITIGDVAGAVIGGIVGGVAIAGIDIGIEAIEGAIAKSKLDNAIDNLFPMRAGIKLSQEKAHTLLQSLQAVQTTLGAIEGAGIPLTEEIIKNLITKDAAPAVAAEQAITPTTVAAELSALDAQSGAWTTDDPS